MYVFEDAFEGLRQKMDSDNKYYVKIKLVGVIVDSVY